MESRGNSKWSHVWSVDQWSQIRITVISVVDRHPFDADPDPTFQFDADPDPDPDPTLSFTHVE